MKYLFIIIVAGALMISCNRGGKAPVMADSAGQAEEMPGSPGRLTPARVDVDIEKSEGAVSIAELLSEKKKYNGKVVTVSGKVTKVNKAIMGRNWIHLQDGTDYEGEYDLTITTVLEPAEGDIVTLTGKIILDKDFGYGYFYDILMEDAVADSSVTQSPL
jgi:hypothetical protein